MGGGSPPWYIVIAILASYLALFGSILTIGFNILLNLYRLTKAENRTRKTYRKLAFFCGVPVVVLMVIVMANWGKLEGANDIRSYRATSLLAEQHFGRETTTNEGCAGSTVQIVRSADPNQVTLESGATVDWHEFVVLETQMLEDTGWTVDRRISTASYDSRALLGFEAQRGDELVTLCTFTGNLGFSSASCVAARQAAEAARNADNSAARPDTEWSALPVTEITTAAYPAVIGIGAREAAWAPVVEGGNGLENYRLLSEYLGGDSRWAGDIVSFGVGRLELCASHHMIRRNFDRPSGQTHVESLEAVLVTLETDGWLVSRQVRHLWEPKAVAIRDDVVLIVTVDSGNSAVVWMPSECVDWSNRTLPDYVEVEAFDT